MGTSLVKPMLTSEDRAVYFKNLISDVNALEKMLEKGKICKGPIHVGAEQEFCLVDEHWEPSKRADEILEKIEDPHFTSELTRYNLETNLDPLELKGKCFSEMHGALNTLLELGEEVAQQFGNHIILTGILPTIATRHLSLDYMTPLERYRHLNEAITKFRGSDVELHIRGVDEINLHHDSIMYEGCNTSFQAHLQIDPDAFRDSYNWAQAVAGPVLGICVNSPLLMGRELWAESRIALFTQSVDTRTSTFLLNEREPRVGFGFEWETGSPADFYKNSIKRFRSLITTEFNGIDSLKQIEGGTVPKLNALNLFNGTVYPWNRLCYGVNNGTPHLRIENRYLPSGPTTLDEIANMMFWVGVMLGRPTKYDEIHTKMDFKDAKRNFFNAARYGMAAQYQWDGKLISSQELLLHTFLPMAYKGLKAHGIDLHDIERYLSVIENRITHSTGAQWMTRAYRRLRKSFKAPVAVRALTEALYNRSYKGYAVDAWSLPREGEFNFSAAHQQVRDLMNNKIITAQEQDSAALVVQLMEWNNIHHIPILNQANKLTGLLSWNDVAHLYNTEQLHEKTLENLMKTELITVTPTTSVIECVPLMKKHKINCLPVVEKGYLVGIITANDFK